MQPDVRIVHDPQATVGELLAEQARRGGSIVLTGGSGVARAYRRAAERTPDWGRVTLWWGDERCVPPDDELSNYRLAKESLLDNLEVQPRAIHRIRGEAPPAEAAAELAAALEGIELDFLLLGLGPDGHMASLFPGSPQLQVTDRRAVDGPAGLEPFVHRVTLTVPTIQSAVRIVFITSGESKADAVARAFSGEVTPDVPASLTRNAPVPVEVFLDEAAAAKMDAA
ncbi:MAG TPA: 6-phosphogluconolactonase [Gaiellaceae bacterium]|nr:6-phosphogluconolactonase [Gaiellaceae bacterium]